METLQSGPGFDRSHWISIMVDYSIFIILAIVFMRDSIINFLLLPANYFPLKDFRSKGNNNGDYIQQQERRLQITNEQLKQEEA